jgi:hypothetical protein
VWYALRPGLDGAPLNQSNLPIARGAHRGELASRRAGRQLIVGVDGALQAGVALLAASALVLVTGILLERWHFPAELEWMEGGSLGHVVRIANGEPLFVEPSPDWVPFIYHPFYYYASWVASWFFGLGLPALRFVSLLGYVATLYGLCRFTWSATHSRIAALIAPAAYAATFELSGSWFDIARVDSLAQGLFMLGLLAVRGRSRRAQLGAATLFYLCFLSKQTTLGMFAPAIAWALVRRGREAWIAAGALAVASGLSVAWMQHSSGGWYWYYCFELPSTHAWAPSMWIDFWRLDLAPVWPVFVILLVAGALAVARPLQWFRELAFEDTALATVSLLGALIVSWFSRLHVGGFLNVLLPGFAALALSLGVAVGRAHQSNRYLGWCFLALVGAQLWMLDFAREPHLVNDDDWQAADRVRSAVAAIDGDVYAPEASSFVIAAGKRPPPHAVAIADVLRGGTSAPRRHFLSALEGAVAERRFSAILLSGVAISGSTTRILNRGYRVSERLLGPETRTGVKTRVNRILRPR